MTIHQLILAIGAALFALITIIAIWYYRKIILPMRGIANGMDLIRAQDFSSRLTKVGQPEADRIVDMFNTMMHRLKTERLRIREQNHFLDLLISVAKSLSGPAHFRFADGNSDTRHLRSYYHAQPGGRRISKPG